MKTGLRILGVVLILASLPCYGRFKAEMAGVQRAMADRGGSSQEHELALAREASHRAAARNWSLSGLGAAVVGVGLVGYSWRGRKRGRSSTPGVSV